MYQSRGNRHEITIDGRTLTVDSNQEEALLTWLEEDGFHDKWRQPEYGMQIGKWRYKPDAEISVRVADGVSTRAIVESKPTLGHLGEKQKFNMRKVAKFYHTDMILLYVHDIKKWYRVDIKTGALSECGVPVPGHLPIGKLYKPFTRYGSKVFHNEYRQRLELGKRSTLKGLELIESVMLGIVRAFFAPPKRRRRTKRSSRRR